MAAIRHDGYWDLSFDKSRQWRNLAGGRRRAAGAAPTDGQDHMISDVPVGVLLSGGVDSTGILRYAVEASANTVQTFTVGFAGDEVADERPCAPSG